MEFQNPASALLSFDELDLSPAYRQALEEMAVREPTAVQALAIPTALSGTDLIAVGQTGSGKTLAFALSILVAFAKRPQSRALVLVPSREMALQIHRVFEALWAEVPISSCVVIGGVADNKQNSQMKKLPRLVIATPGRMNDLLTTNKLLLQGVEIVVIDEADRMLDLGFGPQLKNIQSTMRGTCQTQMYSASFGANVEDVARIFMRSDIVMVRAAQAEKPVASLTQRVLFMTPGMKNQRLQDEINAVKESVIVFAANQESCEKVGKYLSEYGHKVDYVHGALSQGHRSRVLDDFREGKVRVLVATDLMARGIDVASVELVVNFDLPPQPEDFIHRIGRTARVGRKGTAVTFVTPLDFRTYRQIKQHFRGAEEISLVQNFVFTGAPETAARLGKPQQSYRAATAASPATAAGLDKPDKKKKKKYGASNKKKKDA